MFEQESLVKGELENKHNRDETEKPSKNQLTRNGA